MVKKGDKHSSLSRLKTIDELNSRPNSFKYRENYKEEANYKLENLGKYVKELRNAQGWSTAKLADLSTLSAGLINQIENNTCKGLPKPSSLTRLAKVFNVSPNKLLTLAGYLPEQSQNDAENNINDWQIYFKSELINIGLKPKFVDEVINYINTVKIKQKIEEEQEL